MSVPDSTEQRHTGRGIVSVPDCASQSRTDRRIAYWMSVPHTRLQNVSTECQYGVLHGTIWGQRLSVSLSRSLRSKTWRRTA
eukprot:913959-Rhodomonas_salina.2